MQVSASLRRAIFRNPVWVSPIPKRAATDRRERHRFAIKLPVRWKATYRGKEIAAGSGETINISVTGMALRTGAGSVAIEMLSHYGTRTSVEVEATADWPAIVGEALTLIRIYGHLVRAEGNVIAISVMRHEIRTRGRVAQ